MGKIHFKSPHGNHPFCALLKSNKLTEDLNKVTCIACLLNLQKFKEVSNTSPKIHLSVHRDKRRPVCGLSSQQVTQSLEQVTCKTCLRIHYRIKLSVKMSQSLSD